MTVQESQKRLQETEDASAQAWEVFKQAQTATAEAKKTEKAAKARFAELQTQCRLAKEKYIDAEEAVTDSAFDSFDEGLNRSHLQFASKVALT